MPDEHEPYVVPDVLGVIEGWRAWNVDHQGLHSMFQDTVWPHQKELVARCPIPVPKYVYARTPSEFLAFEGLKHRAPDQGCTCGIYASTKKGQSMNIPAGHVYGRVALWGTVIPGTKATRASHAYPIELYAPPRWINSPALTKYGVPIRPIAELPWKFRHRKWLPWVFIGGVLGTFFSILTVSVLGITNSLPEVAVVGPPLMMFLATVALKRLF